MHAPDTPEVMGMRGIVEWGAVMGMVASLGGCGDVKPDRATNGLDGINRLISVTQAKSKDTNDDPPPSAGGGDTKPPPPLPPKKPKKIE